jgi:hypothetical protein
MTVYDRAWSRVLLLALPATVALAWFGRNGFFPIVSDSKVSEAVKIEAGYWGSIIGAAALASLGWIAIRYLQKVSFSDRFGFVVPRLVGIEDEGRDVLLTIAALLCTVGALLIAFIICFIRYTDSHVALWSAQTQDQALAHGFLASRLVALGYRGSEMLRIHAPDGQEYLRGLTDLLLIVLITGAAAMWGWWWRKV